MEDSLQDKERVSRKRKELRAVITIVTLCALIISLFGGYLDRLNKQRLTSMTKAIFEYLKENTQ
jgi:hypothetical protein